MGRVLKILGALLLLCIAFVAITVGAVLFLTQDTAKAGDDFMKAIQEHRLDDAYAMLYGEALDDISSDEFTDAFAERELTSWNFNSRNVNNDQGELTGTAVVDGDTFMPDPRKSGRWREVHSESHPAEGDTPAFHFITLEPA